MSGSSDGSRSAGWIGTAVFVAVAGAMLYSWSQSDEGAFALSGARKGQAMPAVKMAASHVKDTPRCGVYRSRLSAAGNDSANQWIASYRLWRIMREAADDGCSE